MTFTRPIHTLAALVGAPRTGEAEPPAIRPRSTHEVAQVMRTASAEGWRVSVQGRGSWQPPPDADVRLSLLDLEPQIDVRAADLVVSVSAATALTALGKQIAAEQIWIPLDPPGEDRSIGGVIATGTTGTLETGFGPVRDQVLGLTVVTGDGRILNLGGQVVKNVAGFDLIRLMVGAHGAYGIITSATLRARAVPNADHTLVYRGRRDELLVLFQNIIATRLPPTACVLHAHGATGSGALRLRITGSDPHVRQVAAGLRELAGGHAPHVSGIEEVLAAEQAARTGGMLSVRTGFPAGRLNEVDALVRNTLGDGTTLIMPGQLIWSGDGDGQQLAGLRAACRAAGFTTVVERAPPTLLEEAGHYRRATEPQRSILDRLRRVFDPRGVIRCPLESRT